MSILQEYQQIRRQLGERKYRNIEKFLETHPNYYLSDVYYNEDAWNHFLLWEIKNEKDKKRKNKLRYEYEEYSKKRNYTTVYIKTDYSNE